MKKRSEEIAVGLFVLFGLICVAYLTFRLGKADWFGDHTYPIYARFQTVSGLKVGASVEIAGIPVGRVAAITLDQKRDMAVVKMAIQKGMKISDDVIASVKTSGLIGDKFIKLSPGGSDTMLKPGDVIVDTQSAIDIEDLVSKYVFGGVKS